MEIFDRQLKWKDAEVRNWDSQSQYLGDIGTAEDIVMPAYYLEYRLVHSWRDNLGREIVMIRWHLRLLWSTCHCLWAWCSSGWTRGSQPARMGWWTRENQVACSPQHWTLCVLFWHLTSVLLSPYCWPCCLRCRSPCGRTAPPSPGAAGPGSQQPR